MINIIGLALLIVVTVLAYRTAKDYNRSAALWAVATFAVGFFLQIILPIIAVFIIAVIMYANGSTQMEVQEQVPAFTVTVIGLVASIAAGVFIITRLAKVPDADESLTPPPPPENFS